MVLERAAEDEEKWLAEGIAAIQQNAFYMHRALVLLLAASELPPIAAAVASEFPFKAFSWIIPRCFLFRSSFSFQDANNLREALKYSALMLSELRTSNLSPHKYYDLCMSSLSVSLSIRCHWRSDAVALFRYGAVVLNLKAIGRVCSFVSHCW